MDMGIHNDKIKVWDIFVRVFHWSLVSAFTMAYLTEDEFSKIHVIAGYVIVGLVITRLIWGLIGSKHARFSDFISNPMAVIHYLKAVIKLRAKHYIGHNPAGGAMVLMLLASISMTLLFGLLTYGVGEFSGPLSSLATSFSHSTANFFKEAHEFFANFTVILIVFHVIGVAVASFQHKENLVKSMITGYKKQSLTNKFRKHQN